MEQLTKAEKEVMQYIWKLERATVSQMIEMMPEPKPPHSTISSIARILEKKNFVGHKAYGRTYEYFPLVSRDEYRRKSLKRLAKDYFGGSVNNMVSFMVQKEDLTLKDLEEIRTLIENENEES